MSHSKEHHRQKHEARKKAMHDMHHNAVDGPHHDMPIHERMYTEPTKIHPANSYEKDMEMGK